MTRKLPNYMMNTLGRVVDSWLSGCHITNLLHDCNDNESPSYPPFSEFCKFVEKEARKLVILSFHLALSRLKKTKT